ncbi:class I SAM-dependent methyltransferase [Trueperella bernardiae]|uniref:class I SAM-dependent methyltransferase n=1 Tax=Trueperella bernardiae TaxID=59561 RepID=UPI002044576A|nr:class I SAM-dependent methyltransferase [Trueperella bernardiae]MCM3907035.1 class I SAM-dependent methyltransferase [Trueperella bernardiae]
MLLTPDGLELLESLPPYDHSQVLPLSERLQREGYDPDLIAEALTQSRLRERAHDKFGPFAGRMIFTRDGLEQATRLSVGAFHAARLRDAGATHVIDLGCGIGADSLAFAGLGLLTTSIEMDPDAAAAATYNLTPFPEVRVLHADARDIDLASLGANAVWIDPARRRDGKRLKNPEDWAPPLSEAIEVARTFPTAGIKVAPGIDYAAVPEDALVEWISVDGSLVEAVIWLGDAAPSPGRRALVVAGATNATWDAGVVNPHVPPTLLSPEPVGAFIFEPDPAIIRSGSIASICAHHGLAPIAPGIAYLTGNEPIDSPFLTRFTVLGTYTTEPKPLRKALAKLNVGRAEIKKRGTELEPEAFRKKLKLDPKRPGEATLIASPTLTGKHRVFLCER